MTIQVSNHAYVRYLERSLKLNLNDLKNNTNCDADILKELCINKDELRKKIISNEKKISKILETIGGDNISCKIGVGRTHQIVFTGNTAVTVIED